jgi:putative endonuclease
VYYAYILESLRDGTHYFGSSADVDARLREHNAGRSRYTKGHLPYKVLYIEEFANSLRSLQTRTFF